jgi:hypothetical protein
MYGLNTQKELFNRLYNHSKQRRLFQKSSAWKQAQYQERLTTLQWIQFRRCMNHTIKIGMFGLGKAGQGALYVTNNLCGKPLWFFSMEQLVSGGFSAALAQS